MSQGRIPNKPWTTLLLLLHLPLAGIRENALVRRNPRHVARRVNPSPGQAIGVSHLPQRTTSRMRASNAVQTNSSGFPVVVPVVFHPPNQSPILLPWLRLRLRPVPSFRLLPLSPLHVSSLLSATLLPILGMILLGRLHCHLQSQHRRLQPR